MLGYMSYYRWWTLPALSQSWVVTQSKDCLQLGVGCMNPRLRLVMEGVMAGGLEVGLESWLLLKSFAAKYSPLRRMPRRYMYTRWKD